MLKALILMTMLGLINAYIGVRILARWPWASQHMVLSCLFLGLFYLLQLLAPIGNHALFPALRPALMTDDVQTALNWLSYSMLGIASCLFVYTVAADAFDVLWKFLTMPDSSTNLERRTLFTLGIVTAGTTALGIHQAIAGPKVSRVTVPLKNLPASFEGFKIVQISDLHVGPMIGRDYVENVVRIANDLKGDMVALTGDFIDGTVDGLRHDIAPLANLKSTHGSFYVTGNHEYYWDAQGWIEEFKHMGAHVLNNEHTIISKNEEAIIVAGVTDYSTRAMNNEHSFDPAKALLNAPQDRVKILLAHQPNSYKSAEAAGVNLQISGHTHAGQYFPFTMFIGLFQRYYHGLNQHKNMWVYVNRGTGYWGPPLRTGSASEISLLTLTRAQ